VIPDIHKEHCGDSLNEENIMSFLRQEVDQAITENLNPCFEIGEIFTKTNELHLDDSKKNKEQDIKVVQLLENTDHFERVGHQPSVTCLEKLIHKVKDTSVEGKDHEKGLHFKDENPLFSSDHETYEQKSDDKQVLPPDHEKLSFVIEEKPEVSPDHEVVIFQFKDELLVPLLNKSIMIESTSINSKLSNLEVRIAPHSPEEILTDGKANSSFAFEDQLKILSHNSNESQAFVKNTTLRNILQDLPLQNLENKRENHEESILKQSSVLTMLDYNDSKAEKSNKKDDVNSFSMGDKEPLKKETVIVCQGVLQAPESASKNEKYSQEKEKNCSTEVIEEKNNISESPKPCLGEKTLGKALGENCQVFIFGNL